MELLDWPRQEGDGRLRPVTFEKAAAVGVMDGSRSSEKVKVRLSGAGVAHLSLERHR